MLLLVFFFFFFQAEDGIRDLVRSRGLGDVYKRQVPIYLRLGNRARKYSADAPEVGVGSFKNVSISNIIADNVGAYGCSITGLPGYYVENISLENISINFAGGVTINNFNTEMKELEDSCLLYTSDAADERSSVDLGGRRIIKKKKQ